MDLEILNIAADTDNNRNIIDHTHFSKLKNSLCGDEVQIKLIIKNEKIVEFAYQEKSCVYCQASISVLSKIAINHEKVEINNLCDDVKNNFDLIKLNKKWFLLKKLLKKKNISRKECILLPFKALKKIVSK